MKPITIDWLRDVLLAILDDTVEIQIVQKTTKRQRKTQTALVDIPDNIEEKPVPKKRGRKPLSAKQKENNAKLRKKRKARSEIRELPEPRNIFLFLFGKSDGETLTKIAQHFGVRRSVLKPLLQKLVSKKDIDIFQGSYLLKRPIRKVPGNQVSKPEPIAELDILTFVKKAPGKSMAEIAKGLGEENHQRLIHPIKRLRESGKLVEENKRYKLP